MWKIIEDAKKGCAIVLTTHSAEEAHILTDRIGILAKGRLRCIGPPKRLTSRFGAGFFAGVSFIGSTNGNAHPNNDAVATPYRAVKQFFKYVCVTNGGCLHVSQNLVFDFFTVFFTVFGCSAKRREQGFLGFQHSPRPRSEVNTRHLFHFLPCLLDPNYSSYILKFDYDC